MKHNIFLLLSLSIFLFPAPLLGKDMRELEIQARETREKMIRLATEEKQKAQKLFGENQKKILKDKKTLSRAIENLKKKNSDLQTAINTLDRKNTALSSEEKKLAKQLEQTSAMVRELVGAIRISSRDIDSLLKKSNAPPPEEKHPASFDPEPIGTGFPGMEDIRAMVETLFMIIATSSEVTLERHQIVNREGKTKKADLLLLGPFTALYRLGEEVGFLNYSPKSGTYYALSHLPKYRTQKLIKHYLAGESDTVTVDISRGGALRRLTHELSLWEQIPRGGPIIWPILAILFTGILIISERIIFLLRIRSNGDNLIESIEKSAAARDWHHCLEIMGREKKKPMGRVLEAGILFRAGQREELENSLQEAILKEIPAMERFLSTLGMIAAIAPLLGLLGTVTGMIDTFHIITLYGTGDPRLMSGGISEALVTTMLGLSVAIPLMLAQTLLSRSVDRHIGELEEKGITLVNIIQKYRGNR
jgi:biopolymer transport protein ExbB